MNALTFAGKAARVGAVALIAGMLLAPGDAMALTCKGPAPASAVLRSPPANKLAFIGRVASRETDPSKTALTTSFDVLKVVSGDVPRAVTIRDAVNLIGGFPFEVSKAYLVVMERGPGGYRTSICAMPQQDIEQSALLAAAGR